MSKGLLTGLMAVVAIAMICQDTNAQHFGHGRLSNTIHTQSANLFGGANCGRQISYADASNLWADYCFDDCTVGSGCGCRSRCNTGCQSGCQNTYTPISQPLGCGSCGSNSCNGGCAGRLKSKLGGLFSGGLGGGLGCNNHCGGGCFGWPGGCHGRGFGFAGGCGGCDSQPAVASNCGTCDSGCGHGHNRLGGFLSKFHGHRNQCGGGCGCKLFTRGNFHDRMFSNFYSRCGSRMHTGYFGGYVGYETGFGCAHSQVNGVLTGACGCTPASPAMQPSVHEMTPTENPHGNVHPTVEGSAHHAN